MSITTITISDEDFEAQLTSGLASLDGGSATELADDEIAYQLLEASGDKSSVAGALAEIDFSSADEIKVIMLGDPKPIAGGTTICTYKCLALSRGLVS